MRSFLTFAFSLVALAASSIPAQAESPRSGSPSAKQRDAEHKAMSDFAAGDYQTAVGIFSELYADYRDPIYLRNIGRCYQRLKNPDRAISSFEEYLAKAKHLSATERKEINDFIGEMQELQSRQSAKASPAPLPPAATAPAEEPTPRSAVPLPTPAPSEPSTEEARVLTQPPRQDATDPHAGARWVGKGALIFGGVMAAVGAGLLWADWSKYSAADGKCRSSGACLSDADKMDTLKLWSEISFAAAAAGAVTGGVLLAVYPTVSPTPSSAGLQAGVAWTF